MSAVEKIQADAAELGPDEQYELIKWWTASDAFRQRQLTALKGAISAGIDDLNAGRYQTYDDTNVMLVPDNPNKKS